MKQLALAVFAFFFLSTLAFAKIPGAYDPAKGPMAQPIPKDHSLDVVHIDEVLSFTCSHCYDFNKAISKIKRIFGDKVKFTYHPIGWSGPNPSKLYFIAKKYNKGKEVKDFIFATVFESGIEKQINDPQILGIIASEYGIADQFRAELNSSEIISQMNASKNFAKQFQIDSTPTLIIEGSMKTGRNLSNLIKIINGLLKEPVPVR